MKAALDFYQSQAKANRSEIPWLADRQDAALRDFNDFGFPDRHHEEWKYTSLANFLKHSFIQNVKESTVPGAAPALCGRIEIHNGEVLITDDASRLPEGVICKPILDALREDAELIRPYLGNLRSEHAFQALNMAILSTGLFIYVPADLRMERPLVINHWQDQENQAVYCRNVIILESGSQVSIIERFAGEKNCSYFTNSVTEVVTGSHASLTHYKIQHESRNAFHIAHINVQQKAASRFDSHSLSLGGSLVRSDLSILLQEERAQCLMNGIYMPCGNQHMDHHTRVEHQVPNCRSDQDYKGIMTGRSRAVFNGKVVVAVDAQHTEAHQQNKNLLLSSQAEIDTKPQLEIFANDVICSHGATVGQLDEDALFYLATRGIDRQEASRYLIQAFAADNLRLIPDKELAAEMTDLVNQQMENCHD